MTLEFIGKIITANEVEKIRLLLSTFQDGMGQLATINGTLPGWRDFERIVALVFGGQSQESKAIFDVIVPIFNSTTYGISCKMRHTLKDTNRTGRVTLELSNSSSKFWNELKMHDINEKNYENHSTETGRLILHMIQNWHNSINIDLTRSFYLLLQWNEKSGTYQLYQFSLEFPNFASLNWQIVGRRLTGNDEHGKLFEWYGFSGGQLKYYPLVTNAIWVSEMFYLEPLPKNNLGYGLQRKVMEYFPDLWEKANMLHTPI